MNGITILIWIIIAIIGIAAAIMAIMAIVIQINIVIPFIFPTSLSIL